MVSPSANAPSTNSVSHSVLVGAGEPFYFVINEDYEWIAINLYGEQVGPGYVVDEGENITLCMEDDSQLVSLWQTAYGDLSDANGNTLTAMDYISFQQPV